MKKLNWKTLQPVRFSDRFCKKAKGLQIVNYFSIPRHVFFLVMAKDGIAVRYFRTTDAESLELS